MKCYFFKALALLITVAFFSSCRQSAQNQSQSNDINFEKKDTPPEFKIHRYENALFSLNPKNLSSELGKLIPEYSFFLGNQWTDPAKQQTLYNYLTDKNIIEIYHEVKSAYPNVTSIESELAASFGILQKQYPGITIPEVYTYVSGLDIEMPVIYADSVIAIALDDFLGTGNKLYEKAGIPRYKSARSSSDHILPSVMYAVAGGLMKIDPSKQTLLDIMVAEGKALYLADITLPGVSDPFIIGYSKGQMDWCYENEGNIWALLIENNLLYSGDREKTGKFFQDGPHTQGLVDQAPGRLASFMGWQIVKKYMENSNDVSLKQLLENTNAQDILSKSGYKPKK